VGKERRFALGEMPLFPHNILTKIVIPNGAKRNEESQAKLK